jgi:hypothetical protein
MNPNQEKANLAGLLSENNAWHDGLCVGVRIYKNHIQVRNQSAPGDR